MPEALCTAWRVSWSWSRANLRSAARFVFRHDPETVRLVTSNYERKRRKASAKGRAAEADAGVVEA